MKKIMIYGGLLCLVLGAATAWTKAPNAPVLFTATCDPYTHYACLDNYLGEDFITRLWRYYKLELGHAAAPADPHAPPSHRVGWPATPQSTPPMPFTEWPYGATTPIGVSLPNSVDSPLMVSIATTSTGHWMQKNHIHMKYIHSIKTMWPI